MAIADNLRGQKRAAMTGNEAVAYGMKQIEPDVVAAYPITPQTDIVEKFSSYVADGEVDTEFVTVESEHSAMSATVGAAAAGVRAMTATSSNGLAFMWEVVYIASGSRLPIVMPVVNRALSGPINIHCDHSDTMGTRDSGWIQLYSESAQEAYDNLIQAVRIAEHPDVRLPVMVMQDGFITSHGMENLNVLEDDLVKKFIGTFKSENPLLQVNKPTTFGPLDLQDFYFEHKRQQVEGMEHAKKVIVDIAKEYEELTGRQYSYFESYRLDDAEVAIVVLSSTAGTTKVVVDELREQGLKVGLLKPRVLRPFPAEEYADALKHLKAVAVMDRSETFSTNGGPVFSELRSAMFELEERPLMTNYIFGLGGRDIWTKDIKGVYEDLFEIAKTGQVKNKVNYLGVRD